MDGFVKIDGSRLLAERRLYIDWLKERTFGGALGTSYAEPCTAAVDQRAQARLAPETYYSVKLSMAKCIIARGGPQLL